MITNNSDMKAMIYPAETVAPSIHTDFVNGVKFDICEVDAAAYDMLYSVKSTRKPGNRFFLAVEDTHICYFKAAEEYFDKTGECRWDLFCRTKHECMELIAEFSRAYDAIERELRRAEKPAFALMANASANKLRTRCMNIYGTHPL